MTKKYDVIVIGAGPAGMTAALYASRAELSVLMLDRGVYGGQMNNTAEIENYPGFKSILGPDLSQKMYDSSTQFGVEYGYGEVTGIDIAGNRRVVKTADDEYEAPGVVIASGSQYRKLGVPGEQEYSGRGVSYCAVCDGAFFKGETVVVVGGGDSAIQEATYLSNIAAKVIVIHRRDKLRAQKILQERAFAKDNIEFVWNSEVEEIEGNGKKVTGVKIRNNQNDNIETISADGVFIYVGILPMTAAFNDIGITDEAGWIDTNDQMETKVPGIYAVGDVRKKHLRQITTAVGDGGEAGQAIFDYVESVKTK
ncbi:thioredoxin-disulfide reductase [Fructilactobacillus lindneri]|uniref:Thioredoxin reductase n=2 Tax=Fructilactobacillus lindneri TaxID=53444 RepID=A0A0R2JU12_9LACO|nr:thioredoxin-disulfide reductase [Fructilactobacillus lindneri]ANZ58456.1 thioredoxin-disulfide reductase [Fructilactobacillus lindneri]ANZ59766.1 thioredoxin-disulfide reductase [Fructilactobacillus lindneri]KRN79286.1 thioredoxin reductase [Fructilactobacillus lindneri DSM 20690 = JCM 11027]POG98440.1 thioredoxin-disulfide reductase [Fructilactobacillus lindneri]POH03839.1 thioredoxin-disulfide reductase [Fructilactobacillus lindneri]